MGKVMTALLEELKERRSKIHEMGGVKNIEKQHAKGKMTVRERVDYLLDDGTFVELGMYVRSQIKDFDMKDRETPADGVIIGHGQINGRDVCIYATDFTVLAGSAGESHSKKIANLIGLAGKLRVPVIGLLDSAGARLHEGTALSRPFNEIFINQSKYSGVVPQIQLLMGPCAAGQGYSPMLSDFLIMVRGSSWMWLGGPRLTQQMTKEDYNEDIGSADYCMASGQCDVVAENDRDALDKAKIMLSYIPQHWKDMLPTIECDDPADRQEDALLDILPDDRRFTYDMHEIIDKIVDKDSFYEIKAGFGKNIITGFCRLDGKPIGIIANNPDEMGGVMENDASDKYYRFMVFCDAFNIPILTLVDTPAFVVGAEWEKEGILRHGAKLLHAYAVASVPKISVIIRRSYGGGNVVMGSKTIGADFSFAWPTAEISIMGPEGAAAIIWHKDLQEVAKGSPNYAEALEKKRQEYHEKYINPFTLSENYRYDFIDDIIDPRETRKTLIRAFDIARKKQVELPERKHGNPPV